MNKRTQKVEKLVNVFFRKQEITCHVYWFQNLWCSKLLKNSATDENPVMAERILRAPFLPSKLYNVDKAVSGSGS